MDFFSISKWDFTKKEVHNMKQEINLIEEISILLESNREQVSSQLKNDKFIEFWNNNKLLEQLDDRAFENKYKLQNHTVVDQSRIRTNNTKTAFMTKSSLSACTRLNAINNDAVNLPLKDKAMQLEGLISSSVIVGKVCLNWILQNLNAWNYVEQMGNNVSKTNTTSINRN